MAGEGLKADRADLSPAALGFLEERGCHTEWEHIDIVVETTRAVVFIENKIKSSQGPGQLSRYDAEIAEGGILRGRRPLRVLLSLVGEQAEVPAWRCVTYGWLADRLESMPLAADPHEDVTVVRTYVASLQRLAGVVERFGSDPDRCGNVFAEGSLTRARKSGLPPCESPDCQYIRDMQLETVLQRLYLSTIARRMAPDAKSVIVGETRGIALVDIKEPRALRPVVEGGHAFHWGVQFQGGSVKIQLESGYDDEGKWRPPSPEMNRYLREEVFNRVRDFVGLPRLQGEWKFDAPHGAGSAYCSISKPNGVSCWGGALAVAVAGYPAALDEALEVASALSDHLAGKRPGAGR